MAKGKMNKNVHHNGVAYKKDQMVSESDEGFKQLLADGHVDSHDAPAASEGDESGETETEGEEGEGKPEARRRRR